VVLEGDVADAAESSATSIASSATSAAVVSSAATDASSASEGGGGSGEYGFYVKLPPRRRRKPAKLVPDGVDDEKSQANDVQLLAGAREGGAGVVDESEIDLDITRKMSREMVSMRSRASSRASVSSSTSGLSSSTSGLGSSISPGESGSNGSGGGGGDGSAERRSRMAKALERTPLRAARRVSSRPAGLHTPTTDGSGSVGSGAGRRGKSPKGSLMRKVQLLSASSETVLGPSGSEVLDFLRVNNLEACHQVFEKEDIDFETLQTLNESDLEKIGVEKLGTRRKIMRAIVALDSGPMGRPMGPAGSMESGMGLGMGLGIGGCGGGGGGTLQPSAFRPIAAEGSGGTGGAAVPRAYSRNGSVFLASSAGTSFSGDDESGSLGSFPR
jgi:hypothetical protein